MPTKQYSLLAVQTCREKLDYLDTLHRDVVDDPDDATGPGDSQQRMACVGVVGPGTRIEVLICLWARLVKEMNTENS